jgi:hypothetical protein
MGPRSQPSLARGWMPAAQTAIGRAGDSGQRDNQVNGGDCASSPLGSAVLLGAGAGAGSAGCRCRGGSAAAGAGVVWAPAGRAEVKAARPPPPEGQKAGTDHGEPGVDFHFSSPSQLLCIDIISLTLPGAVFVLLSESRSQCQCGGVVLRES